MPGPKWTQSSKAAQILKRKIDNGDFDPDTTPKQAHSSEKEFLKYSLQVFRAHFNKAKATAGMNVRSTPYNIHRC